MLPKDTDQIGTIGTQVACRTAHQESLGLGSDTV